MKEEMLTIKNLTVSYGKKYILKNISFEIPRHSIVGLIGFNGAGKTTLINTLSGIIKSYKVTKIIINNNINCKNFNDLKFKSQRYTVFDYDTSFDTWTISNYLNFVQECYNKNFDLNEQNRLIDGFHFNSYENTPLSNLSFGNRKKVFIIAGLLLKLPLLLLDEPVDGLDFESTEFLYNELKKYTEYGTVIISSHLLDSLNQIADELLVLKDGNLTTLECKEDIYRMMSYDS